MSIEQQLDIYNDNNNNVRLSKSIDRERMDNMLLERKNIYISNPSLNNVSSAGDNEKNTNNVLIEKFKRILSKKFNLKDEDYLVLIDRFQIKQHGITRELLAEMISFLNTMDSLNIKPRNQMATVEIASNINAINKSETHNNLSKSELDKILEERLKEYNRINEPVNNISSVNKSIVNQSSNDTQQLGPPINIQQSNDIKSPNITREMTTFNDSKDNVGKSTEDNLGNNVENKQLISGYHNNTFKSDIGINPNMSDPRMVVKNIENKIVLKDIVVDLTNYKSMDGKFQVPIMEQFRNKWYIASIKSCIIKNNFIQSEVVTGYPILYIRINDIDNIYMNEKTKPTFEMEKYLDLVDSFETYNEMNEMNELSSIPNADDIDNYRSNGYRSLYRSNNTDSDTEFVTSVLQFEEKGEYIVASKTPIGTVDIRNSKKLLGKVLNISLYNFDRLPLKVDWSDGDKFLITFELVSK
jgi:hypothetical protein